MYLDETPQLFIVMFVYPFEVLLGHVVTNPQCYSAGYLILKVSTGICDDATPGKTTLLSADTHTADCRLDLKQKELLEEQ